MRKEFYNFNNQNLRMKFKLSIIMILSTLLGCTSISKSNINFISTVKYGIDVDYIGRPAEIQSLEYDELKKGILAGLKRQYGEKIDVHDVLYYNYALKSNKKGQYVLFGSLALIIKKTIHVPVAFHRTSFEKVEVGEVEVRLKPISEIGVNSSPRSPAAASVLFRSRMAASSSTVPSAAAARLSSD